MNASPTPQANYRLMGVCFVTVIVMPPFTPSIQMRLENHPFPGRPQNYRIHFLSPTPASTDPWDNPVDESADQREWDQEVSLNFIEEIQTLIRTPIQMDCDCMQMALD
jgi:hypothetical protein